MGLLSGYADDSTTTDSDKYLTYASDATTKLTPASHIAAYILAVGNGTTAFLADGAVTGVKLSTDAITIGFAQATSAQAITTSTDLTSLTTTVTVPTGGRYVEVEGFIPYVSAPGGNNAVNLNIMEGATTRSTVRSNVASGNSANGWFVKYKALVTAGSHTYKLNGSCDVATSVSFNCSSTAPAYISVKLV